MVFARLRGFLRGLAFTKVCQKASPVRFTWRDLDFDAGEIVVRGDPETATKNWTVRRVPLIPEARGLFERMRSERQEEPLTQRCCAIVRESQKALDRACRRESGRNASPTMTCAISCDALHRIRRGHSDRFALAWTQRRRRAGNENIRHLRREHSIAQAQRVSFAPVATKQADVIAFPVTA